MTIPQMLQTLKDLGLKKTYKPYWDKEAETIMLHTRKQATIIDGELIGTEINLCIGFFRVWTPQIKKANRIAKTHKLDINVGDNECELFIPVNLADDYLHGFGAKVRHKRNLSPEHKAALKRGREQINSNLHPDSSPACQI